MKTNTINYISLSIMAALLAYVVYVYPNLPDPMPTHWNLEGNVDGYMSKLAGVTTLVAIPVLSFVIFKIIPLVSPRGYRTELFGGVVNALMLGMVVFGSGIAVVAMEAAIGAAIDINKIVFVGVGLLLAFVGNLMGKTRKNFFIGIRTPWTLASDEVWAKTHRLGGWCMVGAGIVMVASALLGLNPEWSIYVVVIVVLIPVVYSYFAYRALEGFEPESEIEDDAGSGG